MMRRCALALLACVPVFLTSCSPEPVVESPSGAHVIWIIADGLRYEEGVAMPSFREFATHATVYEAATATASACTPSAASMFTGLLPSEHDAHVARLRRNGVWTYHEQALQPTHQTVAETFRGLGYETALATANLLFADLDLGLAQGFDELLLSDGTADALNTRIETWLETRTDKPIFLVIDYADTRLGYSPAPGVPWPELDSAADSHRLATDLDPSILGGTEYSPSELALLKARYSDGVASLDYGIEQLFSNLRRRDLYDDALIVLTADHGQSLGEHNLLRSGRGAYEELLHVPLAIKSPKQSLPGRTRDRYSLLHLPRKVLTEAFPEASESYEMEFDFHDEGSDVIAEQWYAHPSDFGKPWSDRFDQVLRVHYRNRWKFIDSDEGTDQLYDLIADPKELDNQTEAHPGVAADMAMRIKRAFGEL